MDDQRIYEKYLNKTHLIGRIGLSLGVLLLVASPFIMGVFVGGMPNIPAFFKGFAQIAVVYIPSCIVEFLIYVPMLGSGGGYLAFLTGNLINMKIPCILNSRDSAKTEVGTPENEIISTLSIATSALVTTVVVALGVVLMIPLTPLLESEALQPAFNNVVPALFGAMATRYFRKNVKIVAIPLLLMSLLFIFCPGLISNVGILMIVSGAIAIAHAWLLFKKGAKEDNN